MSTKTGLLAVPSKIADEIRSALGLPETTFAITLRLAVGEAATVEVHSRVRLDEAEELLRVVNKYELQARLADAPESAAADKTLPREPRSAQRSRQAARHGREGLTMTEELPSATIADSRGGSDLGEELGPLPEPKVFGLAWHAYTAAEMRAYAAEQVSAERERCASAIEALRDDHCAGTGGECHADDHACDFVAAWNDAIAAIRRPNDLVRRERRLQP